MGIQMRKCGSEKPGVYYKVVVFHILNILSIYGIFIIANDTVMDTMLTKIQQTNAINQ